MDKKRIYINKDNEIVIDNKIATIDIVMLVTDYIERVLKDNNTLLIQSDKYKIKIEKL